MQALVGSIDGAHERGGRNSETSHPGGIEQNANLTAFTADYLCFGDIVNALDLPIDFACHAAQRVAVVTVAPEGESQDGNVVD